MVWAPCMSVKGLARFGHDARVSGAWHGLGPVHECPGPGMAWALCMSVRGLEWFGRCARALRAWHGLGTMHRCPGPGMVWALCMNVKGLTWFGRCGQGGRGKREKGSGRAKEGSKASELTLTELVLTK